MRPASTRFAALLRLGATTLTLAVLASGCATPPAPPKPNRSYVMLLDNGDGTTGKVHVTGAGGLTVLETAQSATRMAGGAGNTIVVDEATMKADFAAAVAASPRRPVTYRLYFEFAGAKLTSASRAELPRILEELAKRPAPDISVVGHTDTTGDDASNYTLGLARAKSVVDVLGAQTLIIPADRISIESHGEKNLLVATPNNAEEPRNRRVEVTVR